MKKFFIFLFFCFFPIHFLVCQISMTDGERTQSCDYTFLDPGGVGDYENNLNVRHTLCSGYGERLCVSFTSFSLGTGDFLYIYNGDKIEASELIGVYSADLLPDPILSSGSCLTFRFTTNHADVSDGWAAHVSCLSENPSFNPSESPCTLPDNGLYFYIPNAFTPNGDGENDEFGIKGQNIDFSHFSMQIYNRYGQLVFATNVPGDTWNGKDGNGKESPLGIYVCVVKLRTLYGEEKEYIQTITLLR